MMGKNMIGASAVMDDLARVFDASRLTGSTRAVVLETPDHDHTLTLLKGKAAGCAWPLYHFTVAERTRYNHEHQKWDVVGGESPDCLQLLQSALTQRGGGVFVLNDLLRVLEDVNGDPRAKMALLKGLSPDVRGDARLLICEEPPGAQGNLPGILADQFVRLEIEYPSFGELEALSRQTIASVAHKTGRKIDNGTIQSEASRLAASLVGLTITAARNTLYDALGNGPCDFDNANSYLLQRKSDRLRQELSMEIRVTDSGEDPIGLDYLMQYIQRIAPRMRAIGPSRARGILLAGPPGTGKSITSSYIGRAVGLPVVNVSISSFMDSKLGETEKRMRHLRATTQAMAPVVLGLDEIEKMLGGDPVERDGGTMQRCTGETLSWLSDNPYPVFVVATCNNPRRMGELGQALFRSERFDACYFVDVPSCDSRRRMLERWLTGCIDGHEAVAADLAHVTEKFSGADLRSVVKQANALAEHQRTPVTVEMLKDQIERKRMRAIAVYDEFQELRRWGRLYCEPSGPDGD